MAIAYLITAKAEIERGVSAALELAQVLDKPLAILCLQVDKSEPQKRDEKTAQEDARHAFHNRVDLSDATQECVKQQAKSKGFGGARTEVLEVPLDVKAIRKWIESPPVTEKLGRFSVETLFIPFDRGVGSEKALEAKNQLFNTVPCECVFVSAKADVAWDSLSDVACLDTRGSAAMKRCARRFQFDKVRSEPLTEDTKAQVAIVQARGRHTNIDQHSAWNSLRRNDRFDVVMVVNPADSWWEQVLYRFDDALLRLFAEYQMTRDEREALAGELRRGTRSSPEFILFMSIATLLAAIGLLEDSAAVIIGAMLVAPLMTPLLGAGLAMLQGNWPKFAAAIRAITVGVSIAFLIGIGAGLLAAAVPEEMFSGAELRLSGEMISRSHPNLMDPLIGLAAGLAGGFAIGRDKKIGALAGVAIAAALVPPIATAGIEAAIVLLCWCREGDLSIVRDLLTGDPTVALEKHGMLIEHPGDLSNVRLVFAPLALFVMNACAVILGTFVGLRFVGMHRTMYARQSKRWVSLATVGLLLALVFLLAMIPVIDYWARQ